MTPADSPKVSSASEPHQQTDPQQQEDPTSLPETTNTEENVKDSKTKNQKLKDSAAVKISAVSAFRNPARPVADDGEREDDKATPGIFALALEGAMRTVMAVGAPGTAGSGVDGGAGGRGGVDVKEDGASAGN